MKQKRIEFKELQDKHCVEKERYDTLTAKLRDENKEVESEYERQETQATAKRATEYASKQRAMFINLKQLLELKAQVVSP